MKRLKSIQDDGELIEVIEREMRFVEEPDFADCIWPQDQAKVDQKKLALVRYLLEQYDNTDQDTVLYGPEFTVVVRQVLQGKRPTKLRYLTDFEGEERMAVATGTEVK